MSRAPLKSILRTLRNARGYSQASLAERSGLSWDTVRRLESGSYSPSLTSLIKLALGLRIQLSTLFLAYETSKRQPTKELRDFAESLDPWELDLALKLLTTIVEALRETRLVGRSVNETRPRRVRSGVADDRPAYELVTENLRRLTEAKGIPLTVLADRAGVDRRELFAMMSGEFDADLEWLTKLAEVLEVKVGELLLEEPPRQVN